MHSQSTPQDLSVQEHAALLALLPTAGRERPALRAHTAVLYARVSTDGQDSIPTQLDAGRAYAARHGIPLGYELEDTGSGLSAARADYQRLLSLAESGQISHVIVFKADWLSRDDAEFVPAVRKLMNRGVHVVHGFPVTAPAPPPGDGATETQGDVLRNRHSAADRRHGRAGRHRAAGCEKAASC